MNDMTEEFIKQVRLHMDYGEVDVSQTELAKRLGKSKNYINRVLNGHDGEMPKVWQGILKEIGMTTMPIPEDKADEVRKMLAESWILPKKGEANNPVSPT